MTLNQSWMRRPDLRNVNPWVKVDRDTYQILQIGSFEEINKSKIDGHTMTLSLHTQILEERYDKEMIEFAEKD